MKKIISRSLLAALAATAMTLTACNTGKATDNQATSDPAETTATNAFGATAEQKEALLKSGLLTEADFASPIFIDFNATWCGPCRQFAPYFEAAAEKYASKARFVSVDVDQYGDVANAFGIASIPTVVILSPARETVVYTGTGEIVGEGVFDAIVESVTE